MTTRKINIKFNKSKKRFRKTRSKRHRWCNTELIRASREGHMENRTSLDNFYTHLILIWV
jgi:hypothetical protein